MFKCLTYYVIYTQINEIYNMSYNGSHWRCFKKSHVFYDDPESSKAPMTRAV